MLAEQLGNLQEAEGHYEQHLALASTQQAQDTHGPEWVSAYANVMKVNLDCTSYSCRKNCQEAWHACRGSQTIGIACTV